MPPRLIVSCREGSSPHESMQHRGHQLCGGVEIGRSLNFLKAAGPRWRTLISKRWFFPSQFETGACQMPRPCYPHPDTDPEAFRLQIPHISLTLCTRNRCRWVGVCVFADSHASSQSARLIACKLSQVLCPGASPGGRLPGKQDQGLLLPCLVETDSCLMWGKVSKKQSIRGGFFQWLHGVTQGSKLPPSPFWT